MDTFRDKPYLDLLEICRVARDAAEAAGKAILEVYHRFKPQDTVLKGDNSPLTEADMASDKIIAHFLETHFPNIPYISEESGDMAYAKREHLPYSWLIDPLDGTKEFIRKNGEFTVNIALLKGNQVVAGVVSVPEKGWLYWAYKGGGAWRMGPEGPQPLVASQFTILDPGLRIVASRSHRDMETEAFITRFKEPSFRAMGSSLKILLLASGEAEIYPRFAPTMEWDTAAAQIILEEAGGQLLHAETGKPLCYNKPNRLNPFFIAYGNRV